MQVLLAIGKNGKKNLKGITNHIPTARAVEKIGFLNNGKMNVAAQLDNKYKDDQKTSSISIVETAE